jgi:thiamine monophosphate kinase
MEKIIDAVFGVIEVITITGAIGFGGAMGLRTLHDEVRKETIEALKRPTPSLSHFSRQLTAPSR